MWEKIVGLRDISCLLLGNLCYNMLCSNWYHVYQLWLKGVQFYK